MQDKKLADQLPVGLAFTSADGKATLRISYTMEWWPSVAPSRSAVRKDAAWRARGAKKREERARWGLGR